jgi:ectoine hydroxylase-related dioxygenase (phytanoyl-CoA dioxygenase family)
MLDTVSAAVTSEAIAQYQKDGAYCIRGAFKDWVGFLENAVAENLSKPTPLSSQYGSSEHKGTFYGDRYMWTFSPKFAEFAFKSPAAQLAAEFMGSKKIKLFYDHLLIKEPGAEAPTPWHQDLPYWCVEGNEICSIWLTLDRVDQSNGLLEFVRGSHRWGRQFQGQDFYFKGSYSKDLEQIPDIDKDRSQFDIVSWEMEPGDCVIFDARAIHGAPGNSHGDRRRRALSTRWLGDDVVYRDSPQVTKPIRDPGLVAGAPIECDLFPVVWSR